MDKEVILAKSRKENEGADERNTFIRMQGANFSIGVLIFLWVAMARFAPLDTVGKAALGLLTNATCCSNFAYQVRKNKNKTSLFFLIAFAFATAFYLYQFLSQTNVLAF